MTSRKPRRKRRNRIEQCPEMEFVGFLRRKIGVGMEVEPYGDKWEWRVFYTFDGHRSLMCYSYGSWRRPSPYEVCGRCRDEGDAWLAAREVADDARAMFAAEQIRSGQKREDHLPL